MADDSLSKPCRGSINKQIFTQHLEDYSMFENIVAAPADPILGLGEAFKAETRANKINLGIGVYKDAKGNTPIVKAVKEAEKRLLEQAKFRRNRRITHCSGIY